MFKDWTEFETNYCSDLLGKEVQKEKETNVFATVDEFGEPENDSILIMPESVSLRNSFIIPQRTVSISLWDPRDLGNFCFVR